MRVILMDCQMAGDGWVWGRTSDRQQEQPFPWKAPLYIIAMTASAMQGDHQKCMAAGMDDYVSKPVRAFRAN
jgi:two-component system sensor histidine kinase/response regulator